MRDQKSFKLKDPHGGDWDEWDAGLRVRQFPDRFHRYRQGEPVVDGLRRERKGGLTPVDHEDFKRLDKVVGTAAKSFVEASLALHQIRSRKLYRGTYKTFEDYCQSVHEISRQYANKLINAGRIYAEMETIVSKTELPALQSEAKLRELARIPDPQERVRVFREVMESSTGKGKKITSAMLATAIDVRGAQEPGPTIEHLSPTKRLQQAAALLGDLEKTLETGRSYRALIRKLRDCAGTNMKLQLLRQFESGSPIHGFCGHLLQTFHHNVLLRRGALLFRNHQVRNFSTSRAPRYVHVASFEAADSLLKTRCH